MINNNKQIGPIDEILVNHGPKAVMQLIKIMTPTHTAARKLREKMTDFDVKTLHSALFQPVFSKDFQESYKAFAEAGLYDDPEIRKGYLRRAANYLSANHGEQEVLFQALNTFQSNSRDGKKQGSSFMAALNSVGKDKLDYCVRWKPRTDDIISPVMIIDEASMVEDYMVLDVLESSVLSIWLGDRGQLQPIPTDQNERKKISAELKRGSINLNENSNDQSVQNVFTMKNLGTDVEILAKKDLKHNHRADPEKEDLIELAHNMLHITAVESCTENKTLRQAYWRFENLVKPFIFEASKRDKGVKTYHGLTNDLVEDILFGRAKIITWRNGYAGKSSIKPKRRAEMIGNKVIRDLIELPEDEITAGELFRIKFTDNTEDFIKEIIRQEGFEWRYCGDSYFKSESSGRIEFFDFTIGRNQPDLLQSRSLYGALYANLDYAITAHTAQGDQFDKIILENKEIYGLKFMSQQKMKLSKSISSMNNFWEWFYTAVSRAKKEVIFIDSVENLNSLNLTQLKNDIPRIQDELISLVQL